MLPPGVRSAPYTLSKQSGDSNSKHLLCALPFEEREEVQDRVLLGKDKIKPVITGMRQETEGVAQWPRMSQDLGSIPSTKKEKGCSHSKWPAQK